MSGTQKERALAEAVALIRDGDLVAIGGQNGRCHPMALVREIARQGKRNLHVIGCGNGMDMDLLVGAGYVAMVDAPRIDIGCAGPARLCESAARSGRVQRVSHLESVSRARFQAAAMGLPFLPAPPEPGEDSALRTIVDPFTGTGWMAVEPVRPDVAIIHAHTADRSGNVQLDPGCAHDGLLDAAIARSARITIVSVEQIVSDEAVAARPTATVLPATAVSCVVEAPYGAHPYGCDARYDRDLESLHEYQAATVTTDGFEAWLERWVRAPVDHGAYLDLVGSYRLLSVARNRNVRA